MNSAAWAFCGLFLLTVVLERTYHRALERLVREQGICIAVLRDRLENRGE